MPASLPHWQWLPASRFRAPRRLRVNGVVQHYTAAGNGRALARYGQGAPVSWHALTCRDGHIIQQVDFEHEAVHAGEYNSKGFWKGQPQQDNANWFTIGIENSNYGWLILDDEGKFWLPRKDPKTGHYEMWKPYSGPHPIQAADHLGQLRYWEPYTDALVAANIEILKRITDLYPHLTRADVQSHSSISPHRKFDPGPLFPHTYICDEVFGSSGSPNPLGDVILGSAGDPDEDEDEVELFVNRDFYDEDEQMCLVPGDIN